MIKDVELIRDGNIRGQQVSDGSHNALRFEVAARVIVTAENEYSRIMTLDLHDEIMQVLKIVVVAREQHSVFTHRLGKVDGIELAS